METIYEMTKTYGSGKGEKMMWDMVKTISDSLEADMPHEGLEHLKMKVYEMLAGCHFNEHFANEAVSGMYYTDRSGKRHSAPYWTEAAAREIYEGIKPEIPGYNCWDFYVAMNMVSADNADVLSRWFPNDTEEQQEKRVVELAISWLHDEDNPYGTGKLWHYLMGNK